LLAFLGVGKWMESLKASRPADDEEMAIEMEEKKMKNYSISICLKPS